MAAKAKKSSSKKFQTKTSSKKKPIKAIKIQKVSSKYEKVNKYLLSNKIFIKDNPAISPDHVLDQAALWTQVFKNTDGLMPLLAGQRSGEMNVRLGDLLFYPCSRNKLRDRIWYLVENAQNGDVGLVSWNEDQRSREERFLGVLSDGHGMLMIPMIWENLPRLKNALFLEDADNTVFPRAAASLEKSSLGVGARFTTLHWPTVAWTMTILGIPITANQNSIPRELVYDPDAMLHGKLAKVPFPFIGTSVPEGHQGQSVQGMTIAQIVQFLKLGFHLRRIAYGFNADHQPVGGRFDAVEDELVSGSLFASYITYDLSPELADAVRIDEPEKARKAAEKVADKAALAKVAKRCAEAGILFSEGEMHSLVAFIAPALKKLKRRDDKVVGIREKTFTHPEARKFWRELSIDEIPGETTPETLGVTLALAEAIGLTFQYVAPNIGFQKNMPYGDSMELEQKVSRLYAIMKRWNVSFGFHSGSGKSAENYQICGRMTGNQLEIKTSGRYTYEMGRALSLSGQPLDQALWKEWYAFCRDLAIEGAFSKNDVQRNMARLFLERTFRDEKLDALLHFKDKRSLAKSLDALKPSPDHAFWFEYNFLFILAGGASPRNLGDHGPAGYKQRRRFYAVSEETKLLYSRGVCRYLIYLAENTGIVPTARCNEARGRVDKLASYAELLRDIAP
jgi:hypothetical protein